MLFSSESKRSGENIVNAPMLISRVAEGNMTWDNALKDLPMHPVGAEEAKRELGRSDQKRQLPTQGSLAAKIAELEAKATQEYIKLMHGQKQSEDPKFVLKTVNQAQRLVEKEMRKFYGI